MLNKGYDTYFGQNGCMEAQKNLTDIVKNICEIKDYIFIFANKPQFLHSIPLL